MNLSTKQRKILKIAGFIALGLFTFLFALAQTFPYDRIKDRLITELSDKYDVTIADVHAGWLPGTVIIEGFSLKTRPSKPDEKPTAIFIEEIEIDIGLLALIRQHYNIDVVASVTGGEIEVEVRMSKTELDVEIHTEGLPLQSVPGVAGVVGLPMGGPLAADVSLEVPIEAKGKRRQLKWSEAEGKVSLQCAGCTIGDGEAKLKMTPREGASTRLRQRMMFAAEGITVPKLSLGNAVIDLEISSGIGKFKSFQVKSKDGELSFDGELRMAEPFKRSTLPGCIRFSLSDSLKKREPNFGNIEFTLPARARQDDGSFAIPTKGTLARFRLNHRGRCDAAGGGDEPRDRPSITARPELRSPPSKDERTGADDVAPPEPGTPATEMAERLQDVARQAGEEDGDAKRDGGAAPAGEEPPAGEGEGTGEAEIEGEGEVEAVPEGEGQVQDEGVIEE